MDLAFSLIIVDKEAKWDPADLTLRQCGVLVSKSWSDSYVSYWWGLGLHVPYRPDSLSLSLFNSGIGKTKGVCRTDQLFLCYIRYVKGLWPSLGSVQETNDIIVPTAQHSSPHPSCLLLHNGKFLFQLPNVSFCNNFPTSHNHLKMMNGLGKWR